jgi:tRNA pseudouridine38-40 synthase
MDYRKTYFLKISYDGTPYVGWQVQPNGLSVQGVLQEKLSLLLKEDIRLVGSGRTDSGVHALGQCAHFRTEKIFDPDRLLYPLNAILPYNIRILAFQEVPNSFHARFSAQKKIYHYHIALGGTVLPFLYRYRTYVRKKVDLDLLKEGAKLFVGTHNFAPFANENDRGSAKHKPVKTLYRVEVVEEEGGIRIEFEGDGFLYKMVRNMVGQLLTIGQEKAPVESIPEIFASGDRKRCAAAAPAQGLFLVAVHYPEEFFERRVMDNSLPLESLDLGIDEG